MKQFLISVVLLLALIPSARAQSGEYAVFEPITKYIAAGDAASLSSWFADNLEISIGYQTNTSSKNQARQILKSFFEENEPRSFIVTSRGSQDNMKYAFGQLSAGGEVYLVTIRVYYKNDSFKIGQIKIDPQ